MTKICFFVRLSIEAVEIISSNENRMNLTCKIYLHTIRPTRYNRFSFEQALHVSAQRTYEERLGYEAKCCSGGQPLLEARALSAFELTILTISLSVRFTLNCNSILLT